jgi:xanthine phosphoribosyltransferase
MKTLNDILFKIREMHFPPIDAVIGIARGGIIPAALVAEHLNREIDFIWINRRNEKHEIVRNEPLVYRLPQVELKGKNILLVEDRVKSGISLDRAKKELEKLLPAHIYTFAVNGKADICLYNESCFPFPWKI